ncbi:multi antimicrobial extrusion protein (Na(+)/drug antiporter), MATE family of MDR efflux pumps [Lachnospiraceae bacterium KM106-2]|nr:multi antimicrobial extrusion protein (Na(+)/drug antiporter), MATE family of MDR efflux pumps [Lachnospiraceae bacterium KM106-2]
MKQNVNLLEGPIFPSLTKLAIPIMATSMVQMAYNMIDMIWIGRIGSGAVAAVGAAGMYMWLSNGLSTLSKMGGQIKVGQTLGAGERKEAAEYATSAIQLALIYGFILSAIIMIFADPFIRFLGLNATKVIADGIIYLQIVSIGIIFSFINQVLTGIFTAMGNSTISFRATAVGLVMNIVLDPLFIFGFGPVPAFGVAGAAIATVLSQAVVTLMFIPACRKDQQLFHEIKIFRRPNTKDMAQITKIGLPVSIQSMVFTGISMIISRLVAGFGDEAVAVQKVGSQIESISWMTADGISAAVNSFLAQNYGARNYERVNRGYKVSMVVVVIWGMICTALLIFLPGPIFRIFIPEAKVLPMGISYLQILGVSQLFMCMEIATQGAFGGLGKTIPPSVVSITFTAARIPMAMLLSATALGLNGIWWSISISSMIKGIVLVTWFIFFLRKFENRN